MKAWIAGIAILTITGLSQQALAQSGSGMREGRWETRLGMLYQDSSDASFDGGTTANIDSELGFRLGIGYHWTSQVEFGFNFDWVQPDYSARIVGDQTGEIFPVKGDLEYMSASFDATYNFMPGQFTPFVTGAIGWSWVDTNIATEPPQTGCWWDPWWGYVCTSFQDTRTIDGFTYAAGLGARYDINEMLSLSASYRITWYDWPNASGSVDSDSYALTLGWKF